MLTRAGQMTLMGDTMEVLFAIEQLIKHGRHQEAAAYAYEARSALTQMANGWVHSDAAYSVLAKSLKVLPEVLINEQRPDDTEPSK